MHAMRRPVNWSQQFIVILAFTGVVSTALCWALWLYLLKHLSAGATSMSTLAVPVIAIAAAAYHLGERPTMIELVGMTLIICALVVLALTKLSEQRSIASEMAQE